MASPKEFPHFPEAKIADVARERPGRTAILLVNLGTPDEPTAPAVKRYLKEFLSDRRVVELPRLVWWAILNGLILPIRSSRSAAKYSMIWHKDKDGEILKNGSPLRVWTEIQAKLLRGWLGSRGHQVMVEHAMRYGNPSISHVLGRLGAEGCERVLVLQLYPQYSATTTASTIDAVNAWCAGTRDIPEIRFVKHYFEDPAYIAALARNIVSYWEKQGREIWPGALKGRLVLSFHGLPKRNVERGDPYRAECLATARLLVEALELPPEQVAATFQSRFGRAEWLQPYTAQTLQQLAKDGVEHVDICCPGFPADCLETLEEIAIEARQIFLGAGGKSFRYLPCMNDDPAWIAALGSVAERHLCGWPTRPVALKNASGVAI